MRLVAYTDAAGVGGAEISLANLLTALIGEPGLELTVLGSSAEVVERVAPDGAPAIVTPTSRHPAALARLRPDVVHANLPVPWSSSIGLAAALALPGARVVAVQQLPLRTVRLPAWLRTRELLRRLDAHVAVGEQSCRLMEDFYALGRGSVRSIPNFVPDVPCPAQPRLPSDGGEQGLVVGSLGRLDRVKGYDLLLRAVAAIPSARLVVLGEGDERAALEQQARDLGIVDRVELAGWDPDPRRRLAEWDVFCLPSRSEGFPLSIVEAMLAGLPVVATRVGSVPEAVQDQQTGILVAKDDVAGLTDALSEMADPARREAFGRFGRKHALEHFTVEKMAEAFFALYEELISRPRRSRLRPGPEKA